MYAAVSDLLPVEQVKMLLDKGANVNAKSQHSQSGDTGRTALDIAKFHGNTPVVDLLLKSGATSAVPAVSMKPASMRSGNTIQAAVPASLALLQRTDASFVPKAGCFSCHNQSLAAMAVGLARKNGFRVDEQTAARQVKVNAGSLAGARDLLHQGTSSPDDQRQSGDSGVCSFGAGCGGLQARPQHRCCCNVHPDAPDGRMATGLPVPTQGLRCAPTWGKP